MAVSLLSGSDRLATSHFKQQIECVKNVRAGFFWRPTLADRAWNFPESIFVITGWSPQGVDLGEWAHEKANRTIANTITDIGGRFLHGHGRSPSGDHSEPSLFAWGISDADAMEIARRANQDAIFEVTANEVTLRSCDDGSRESWSRFQ